MNSTSDHDEAFRDTVAHIDGKGHRVWFYPKKPSGKFYNARSLVTWIYLSVFFSLPFIKVHGEPLFLLNVVERKFILFGVRFWPQDFFLFMLGMITFIVFIALFTVVYGRVFCGWICPQTVFMEMVFRKIEYAIEGNPTRQRALNNGPWNREKITKKSLKTLVFFVIAVLVANTFLAYIIGVDELYKIATEPISSHVGGFIAMIIFSGLFFFIFSWFREQVCLVVCPYGRMQGVLLDKDSIVVAYDHVRGEPRGKVSKAAENKLGDCIDCGDCVRVCPTGIDIRHGTQLECTNCTACMDACDHIMQNINRPQGLIRYASENSITKGVQLKLTPRIIAYSLVLITLLGLESFLLITRKDLDLSVVRAKGTLFYTEPDGRVSNLFNIKVINKTREDIPLTFKVRAMEAEVRIIGDQNPIVGSDSLMDAQFFVLLNKSEIKQQTTKVVIEVWNSDHLVTTAKTTFIGPAVTH